MASPVEASSAAQPTGHASELGPHQRKRTIFSAGQLLELERVFAAWPYPDIGTQEYLAWVTCCLKPRYRCGFRMAGPRESGSQEASIPGLSVPRTAVLFQMSPSSPGNPKWWASLYLSPAELFMPQRVCRLPVKLPAGL